MSDYISTYFFSIPPRSLWDSFCETVDSFTEPVIQSLDDCYFGGVCLE